MIVPHQNSELRVDQRFDRCVHRQAEVAPGADEHLPIEEGFLDYELGELVERASVACGRKDCGLRTPCTG